VKPALNIFRRLVYVLYIWRSARCDRANHPKIAQTRPAEPRAFFQREKTRQAAELSQIENESDPAKIVPHLRSARPDAGRYRVRLVKETGATSMAAYNFGGPKLGADAEATVSCANGSTKENWEKAALLLHESRV